MVKNVILRAVTLINKKTYIKLVRVFSDVLVAFLYFDICHYRQSNLASACTNFLKQEVMTSTL